MSFSETTLLGAIAEDPARVAQIALRSLVNRLVQGAGVDDAVAADLAAGRDRKHRQRLLARKRGGDRAAALAEDHEDPGRPSPQGS